ncbi:calcium-transporting ATPase plasma membrane-type-like, partial [Trifolium medium]|nr:calcium-transporting ATPase plasma membrane-type-like [Trifolium medium]
EKIRIALYVQKAALQFIDAGNRVEYKLSEEAIEAGFDIHPNEIASIVRSQDYKNLSNNGGVEAVARKLSVSTDEGVSEASIDCRQQIFGANRYTEKPSRTFLMFVWDALQDLTLTILM